LHLIRHRDNQISVFAVFILAASLILVTLPFYVTFNEMLTAVVKAVGLWFVIDTYIAPVLVSMVSSLFLLLGIEAAASGSIIYLTTAGQNIALYIAWNCIGWQSMIIFLAMAYFAYREVSVSTFNKIVDFLVGFQVTILINVLRIVLVGLIAIYFGSFHAILFHDYVGSLISFAWLAGYWYMITKNISERGGNIGD